MVGHRHGHGSTLVRAPGSVPPSHAVGPMHREGLRGRRPLPRRPRRRHPTTPPPPAVNLWRRPSPAPTACPRPTPPWGLQCPSRGGGLENPKLGISIMHAPNNRTPPSREATLLQLCTPVFIGNTKENPFWHKKVPFNYAPPGPATRRPFNYAPANLQIMPLQKKQNIVNQCPNRGPPPRTYKVCHLWYRVVL